MEINREDLELVIGDGTDLAFRLVEAGRRRDAGVVRGLIGYLNDLVIAPADGAEGKAEAPAAAPAKNKGGRPKKAAASPGGAAESAAPAIAAGAAVQPANGSPAAVPASVADLASGGGSAS